MKKEGLLQSFRFSARLRSIKRRPSRSWRLRPPPRQESAHLRKYATFAVTSRVKNAYARCYQAGGMEGVLDSSQR